MVNAHNPHRRPVRAPSVVLGLFALLVVFFSSVTYQQTAAPQAVLGFVGTLDHLVVPGYQEALRLPTSNTDKDSGDSSAPDLSDPTGRLPFPVIASCLIGPRSTCAVTQPGRYLCPQLRAPPLA